MSHGTPNDPSPADFQTETLPIWPNGTEEQPRHNVTFSRLYKDEVGEWKSTQSFGRNDLLVLAKVADQAHTRLFELLREEEQQAES